MSGDQSWQCVSHPRISHDATYMYVHTHTYMHTHTLPFGMEQGLDHHVRGVALQLQLVQGRQVRAAVLGQPARAGGSGWIEKLSQ